jgi:hypothetical protein
MNPAEPVLLYISELSRYLPHTTIAPAQEIIVSMIMIIAIIIKTAMSGRGRRREVFLPMGQTCSAACRWRLPAVEYVHISGIAYVYPTRVG